MPGSSITSSRDRKSTRLNSSHTVIYTLSLHDALPIFKDSAFFARAPHLVYGGLIGAEFLFLDAWIQHHQFTDGSAISTWTQFGAGAHGLIDLGDAKQQK